MERIGFPQGRVRAGGWDGGDRIDAVRVSRSPGCQGWTGNVVEHVPGTNPQCWRADCAAAVPAEPAAFATSDRIDFARSLAASLVKPR